MAQENSQFDSLRGFSCAQSNTRFPAVQTPMAFFSFVYQNQIKQKDPPIRFIEVRLLVFLLGRQAMEGITRVRGCDCICHCDAAESG
jgi:hypothetical protein